MSDEAIGLSVVMLSWNTRDLTLASLGALQDCLGRFSPESEVIVIDNASSDDSVEAIRRDHSWVRLFINDENLGYARGVNQGLRLARGQRVLLLGSDAEVRGDTLETLWRFLDDHDEVGAVAPRCVDPDGSIQRGCMRFPDLQTALFYDTFLDNWIPGNQAMKSYFYKDWNHEGTRSVDQPPGTCFLVRREVIEEVGLMDRKLWLLFNDVDWCLRIRKQGWEIYYVDEGTEVMHHRGGSTSKLQSFPVEWHRNRVHFYRKHFHLMGVALAKLSLLFVGIREVCRIRRNLEDDREFRQHAGQIIRAMGGVLLRG